MRGLGMRVVQLSAWGQMELSGLAQGSAIPWSPAGSKGLLGIDALGSPRQRLAATRTST